LITANNLINEVADPDIMAVDYVEESRFSIPRYCKTTARASSLATFTADMKTALDEMEACGDGGSSDVEEELCTELDEEVEESEIEKRDHEHDNEVVQFIDRNLIMLSDAERIKFEKQDDLNKYVPSAPEK